MNYLPDISAFSNTINIRNAFMLVIATITVSTIGYMVIEGYTLLEAFYMTVITISTVGYTEVRTLTDAGRLFSAIMILINIGVVAYTVSAFMDYTVNGKFFKKFNLLRMKEKIQKLRDHIIICGYSKVAEETMQNFASMNQPMVLIERDADKIEEYVKHHPKGLFIEADASADEVLEYAQIHKAKALITAISDDSENIFITLSARQLCPTLNIVARTADAKTEQKLIKAGADHILMPEIIAGFYMAQLVNKPGAVEFFTHITNKLDADVLIEEIEYKEVKPDFHDKSLREIDLQNQTGANIIAILTEDGEYIVNPAEDTVFHHDSKLIALGTEHQIKELRRYCGC
ncbi:MAG: potassium channel protein [Bacteroidia bacterium]|nr:potassium channel protein [Bacteroidia bacterium]